MLNTEISTLRNQRGSCLANCHPPWGSQPCQSGSICYKACVRAEDEDRQSPAVTHPHRCWESVAAMHEIPAEPGLSAEHLSQACNWYLSEEKGGPWQLCSCREMKEGSVQVQDSEVGSAIERRYTICLPWIIQYKKTHKLVAISCWRFTVENINGCVSSHLQWNPPQNCRS